MTSHSLIIELSALQNSALIFAGVYLHEQVVHAPFDWRLLMLQRRRRRPAAARMAVWVYLACRILLVVFTVCGIIAAIPTIHQDCRTVYKFISASGFLGIICSSSLLSIRVGAVWKWDKRVLTALALNCLATLALAIYLVVKIDSTYDPTLHICTLNGVRTDLYPSVASFVGDCTPLALLLVGLRRNWKDARQFHVWHTLWNQGLIYLCLAIAVEVPLIVLLILNINPILNTILVTPEVVILAIGATRMYRYLNATSRGQSIHTEHFTNGTSHDAFSRTEFQLKILRHTERVQRTDS
ncbi:unnamed protein product [Peniophora sp. CBMAI 1063]|nr:unnamed protein product [Peniophora sp. CBMAI 1063]